MRLLKKSRILHLVTIFKFLIPIVIIITGYFIYYLVHIGISVDNSTERWFVKGDKTLEDYDKFRDIFGSDYFIVVSLEAENIYTNDFLKKIRELKDKIEELPNIEGVDTPLNAVDIKGTVEGLEVNEFITKLPASKKKLNDFKNRISTNHIYLNNFVSSDGKAASILIWLERILAQDSHKRTIFFKDLNNILEKTLKGKFKYYLAGGLLEDDEIDKYTASDFIKFMPGTVLALILILLIIFRSFLRIVLPILVVGTSVTWTLAILTLLNFPMNIVTFIIPILLLVIGVASSIHLLSHFNQEQLLSNEKILSPSPLPLSPKGEGGRIDQNNNALVKTLKKVSKPIILTCITTAIGFLSLTVSKIEPIKELGYFACIGIIICMFLTFIIITPCLKILKPPKFNYNTDIINKVLNKISQQNIKAKKLVLIIFGSIFVIIGVAILFINVETHVLKMFPDDSRISKAFHFINEKFSGANSFEVVLYGDEDDFKEPANLKKIEAIQAFLKKQDLVANTFSIVDYIKLINKELNEGNPKYFKLPKTRNLVSQELLLYELSEDKTLEKYIDSGFSVARINVRVKEAGSKQYHMLRTKLEDHLNNNLSNITYNLTGMIIFFAVLDKYIIDSQVQSFSLALGIIIIIMFLIFGLKVGLVSILPNIFPIALLFGCMGLFRINLDAATVLLASIAIGISVDDTIHYISHHKRNFKKTRSSEKAVQASLFDVGKAMVVTTIVLSCGFIVMTISDLNPYFYFGLLSAITMVGALVADLFLCPSLFLAFKKKVKPLDNGPIMKIESPFKKETEKSTNS